MDLNALARGNELQKEIETVQTQLKSIDILQHKGKTVSLTDLDCHISIPDSMRSTVFNAFREGYSSKLDALQKKFLAL